MNMNSERPIRLIAIVGGSGAGKTWLADRLQQACGSEAGRLTLDDFYRDRSHLSPARRAAINFDHPRAIDWPLVLQALRGCREGRLTRLPRYSFATHTRLLQQEEWLPPSLVLMDGLWLFWRPAVRELFDLRIFLVCATQLRLERRLARDVAERGRTPEAVREQFWKTVAPMHDQFVAPQSRWADLILSEPPSEEEIQRLVDLVQRLEPRAKSAGKTGDPGRRWLAWPRTEKLPSFATPQPLCVFQEGSSGLAERKDLIGS
jgi:uridine kinase